MSLSFDVPVSFEISGSLHSRTPLKTEEPICGLRECQKGIKIPRTARQSVNPSVSEINSQDQRHEHNAVSSKEGKKLRAFALTRLSFVALSVAMLSACGQTAVGTKTEAPTPVSASALRVYASLAPGSRALSGQFFGYNLDVGAEQAWQSDPHLAAQAASMAPGTLRYPGGTVANYWNWVIGWYGTRPNGAKGAYYESGKSSFTLQDLKQLVKASGATPIFDVNIMTATLKSQVEMLQAAQRLGLPVRLVELGNEFYLPNPDYVRAFPTPLTYAQRVAAWLPTLHKDFPGAQIAAVGYAETGKSTLRESTWNVSVLRTAAGLQDLTMHIYFHPRAALGVAGSQHTEQVLALPFSQWDLIEQHSLQTLPRNTNIWITEFNMMNNVKGPRGQRTFPPPQGTWTQGLFAGTMDLLFLRDPRIALVDYHALVGTHGGYGALNPNTGQPSPSGAVQQLIHRAAAGMTFSQTLTFGGGPLLLGKYPGLVGAVFRNSVGTAHAVVLNLSNRAVSMILPPVISTGMVQEEIQGAPSATNGGELHKTKVNAGKIVTLQSYSVTYLYSGSDPNAN